MTGLEKIIEQILARGREQAREILQQAEQTCSHMALEYAERNEAVRVEIAEECRAQGEQIVADAKAEADRVREQALSEARQDVMDEVLAAARRKLCSTEHNKYTELLVGLLSSALMEQHRAERAQKGESTPRVQRFEVVMSGIDHDTVGTAVIEGTRRLVERRIGADKAARLVLSHERLNISGGMLLRFDDMILDYTMDTLLAEVCTAKAAELQRVLFGV